MLNLEVGIGDEIQVAGRSGIPLECPLEARRAKLCMERERERERVVFSLSQRQNSAGL
jgi:hypothetical protein